jgi:hypothetical protein
LLVVVEVLLEELTLPSVVAVVEQADIAHQLEQQVVAVLLKAPLALQ